MSERIYVDRTTTWHAIGKSVEECKDLGSVLTASGLDYEVGKKQVFMIDDLGQPKAIPNRFVTTRLSDGHPYDVVSDKFEVVQNADAFDFVNYMGEDLQFEKAGETATGMVYIIGKLPQVDILGDAFTPHVIFRNGFSGKVKITAAICPLRMVCQNQFNFAFNGTENTVTIRHLANAEAKLREAREILKVSADYMDTLTKQAQIYAQAKMSQAMFEKMVDHMFPMPTEIELETMNSFKRSKLESAREQFLAAYNADDNGNFRGTAWGIINAYTDYITHRLPTSGKVRTREEGKFIKTTFQQGGMNEILNVVNMFVA